MTERRRVFPKSKPGDVVGLIKELWGEDDPRLDLHFVCEALFEEHDRISLPMIQNVMGGGKCDGLVWLVSDAAGYLDMVLEYVDPETGGHTDLPMAALGEWLYAKRDERPAEIANPATGKLIGNPDEMLVWFERTGVVEAGGE